MYTNVIGRIFLKAFNEREKLSLTAKEFFETRFLPLFFDYPKYMMTGGNSPLENPKISWKKGSFPSKEDREHRIKNLIEKIETCGADASIALGFSTLDETAVTSCQTTNLIKFNKEEIYLSWIGGALGVGVEGALVILFSDEDILLKIYEGWKVYRSYLQDPDYKNLKGSQINTWNGQWIIHALDNDLDLYKFDSAMEIDNPGELKFSTQKWAKIIFSIAKNSKTKKMLAYVYNIGQTNTTIGFIPLSIDKVLKPIQLYKKLFGDNNYLKDAKRIESIYGTYFGFRKVCQMGQIGLQALEPKGLREYMVGQKNNSKLPNYQKANEEQLINYNTFITWILAMLDNEKLWELAGTAAKTFIDYVKSDEKKSNLKRQNKVNAILEAKSKKTFLEEMIPILEDCNQKDSLVELGHEVHQMVNDNFPYFQTLIRFRYAEINNN